MDRQYLEAVKKVLSKGRIKKNRTGVDALTMAAITLEHDMSEGFPLLTTKKMPLRVIAVELEGFLRGITNKSWYQERGCRIWDEWSNPKVAQRWWNYVDSDVESHEIPYTIKDAQRETMDLGPIYGYQWRHFGAPYNYGQSLGVDQLDYIVQTLKNNPNDRRMLCSAWSPGQFEEMALPPCHVLWNVVVIDDTINLLWYQRSCDLMLGVPFNVASYALLLLLLAKESGLKPGTLHGTLADCHIYENHVEKANLQISREPKELPTVTVGDSQERFSIYDWTYEDFKLSNYFPHPRIDFGGVAV